MGSDQPRRPPRHRHRNPTPYPFPSGPRLGRYTPEGAFSRYSSNNSSSSNSRGSTPSRGTPPHFRPHPHSGFHHPPHHAHARGARVSKRYKSSRSWRKPYQPSRTEKLVFEPLSGQHTHTLVLLHGGGESPADMAKALLEPTLGDGTTIRERLPNMRFVLPAAKMKWIEEKPEEKTMEEPEEKNEDRIEDEIAERAEEIVGIPVDRAEEETGDENETSCSEPRVWFTNYRDPKGPVTDVAEFRTNYTGLAESIQAVYRIIREEARKVSGPDKIVLLGYSQGATVGLGVCLNWLETPVSGAGTRDPGMVPQKEEPLGAFVGLHGWLAFLRAFEMTKGLTGVKESSCPLIPNAVDRNGPIFDEQLSELVLTAIAQKMASIPRASTDTRSHIVSRIPMFLGHGSADERVPVDLGQRTRDVLTGLGCTVNWREYEAGHALTAPEELEDVATFLQSWQEIQPVDISMEHR